MDSKQLVFGLNAPLEVFDQNEMLRQVLIAEKAGIDKVWAEDHFMPWYHTNARQPYAFTWIGAALQATKKVGFGTAVTCPIMRYNPAIVAQIFASLSDMFPGRICMGVGSGEPMNEVPPTGMEWPSIPERQDMMVESIQLMNKLWTSKEPVTFKGKYYKTEKAFLYTKPKGNIPMYISGLGPRGAKMAGIYGDNLLTLGAPDQIKNIAIPAFMSGLKEAGKDASKAHVATMVGYSFCDDFDKACQMNQWSAGSILPIFFKYKVIDPMEVEICGKMVDKNLVGATHTTNIETVYKTIEYYINAGVSEFIINNTSPDIDLGLEQLKKIITYFKN